MKKVLLAGVAMGALMAGAAQAQVQSSAAGFFGTIDGLYSINSPGTGGMTQVFPLATERATVGDGFGGAARLGYAFGGAWDVAIAGSYTNFSGGTKKSYGPGLPGFTQMSDGELWTADLEVGYTISGPGYGVRPNLGVRYAHWTHTFVDTNNTRVDNAKSYGIGPKVGVDASMRLTDSISLIGGVETAFLFGKVKDRTTLGSSSDSRMIWQIGGKLGLDWEIAPLWHLAAGYRATWWDGLISGNCCTLPGPLGASGRSGILDHGPFVRLAYNWGAPPSGPMAPKPPAATGKKSYIVFFDFDRALITPTAATTIKQAAADAKAGKSTRLDVTGHADKSGGDAYNMALSLRRGNAVKDQLVREGIPANQIAVVGRGESMPLVQTADGVREPQNRRVEIVLN